MIGKEKIKFVRSLHQKKFRQKYNKFIAEGPKIVSECLSFCAEDIETIYALPSYIQTIESQPETINKKLIVVNEVQLRKISALKTPNQVLAVINRDTKCSSITYYCGHLQSQSDSSEHGELFETKFPCTRISCFKIDLC